MYGQKPEVGSDFDGKLLLSLETSTATDRRNYGSFTTFFGKFLTFIPGISAFSPDFLSLVKHVCKTFARSLPFKYERAASLQSSFGEEIV